MRDAARRLNKEQRMSEAVATVETTAATTEATAATTEQTTTATTTETPAFDSAAHYQSYLATLTDAERKDHAARFKSVDDILDGNLKQRKELSSRIKVPDEKSTPEEIAAFRKAIKASDKAEDYKAATPEGYELGEPQQALLGQMQKAAAEQGLPVAAFENFTKTYFEMEQAVQAKVAEEVDTYRRENELALKKEFGKDYERFTKAAKLFVDTKLQVPEFTSLLEDKIQWNGVSMQLGSHPAVVKMLAQIGMRAGEDGLIGHTSPDERASLQAQIRDLRAKHPFGTPAYTADVDRKISELTRQLHGE
jgi:hypothetical protein